MKGAGGACAKVAKAYVLATVGQCACPTVQFAAPVNRRILPLATSLQQAGPGRHVVMLATTRTQISPTED